MLFSNVIESSFILHSEVCYTTKYVSKYVNLIIRLDRKIVKKRILEQLLLKARKCQLIIQNTLYT